MSNGCQKSHGCDMISRIPYSMIAESDDGEMGGTTMPGTGKSILL